MPCFVNIKAGKGAVSATSYALLGIPEGSSAGSRGDPQLPTIITPDIMFSTAARHTPSFLLKLTTFLV